MTEIQVNTDWISSFEWMEICEIWEWERWHKTVIRFTREQLEYTLLDDGECMSFTDQFGVIRRWCFSDDWVQIYEKLQSLKEEDVRAKEKMKNKDN